VAVAVLVVTQPILTAATEVAELVTVLIWLVAQEHQTQAVAVAVALVVAL
jgi:hypothetical protein